MAIPMQGEWTVSVKSKNAAFPQRFIIAGADSGNGTYVGDVATAPVPVTGPNWRIQIQNNPGSGFVDSADQIKFPTVSGGQLPVRYRKQRCGRRRGLQRSDPHVLHTGHSNGLYRLRKRNDLTAGAVSSRAGPTGSSSTRLPR